MCQYVDWCCVACLNLLFSNMDASTPCRLRPSGCCRDTQQYYQRFFRESFVNHEDEGPERLGQIVSRAREDAQWVLKKVGLLATAGTWPVLLEQFSRLRRTLPCRRVKQCIHMSPSVPSCSGLARSARGLGMALSAALGDSSVGGGCGSTPSPRTGAPSEGGSDAAAAHQQCSSACGEQAVQQAAQADMRIC